MLVREARPLHIVIAISFGTVVTTVILVWLLINVSLVGRRRRKLALLRAKQEVARLKQVEKALLPRSGLWRWRLPFRK